MGHQNAGPRTLKSIIPGETALEDRVVVRILDQTMLQTHRFLLGSAHYIVNDGLC